MSARKRGERFKAIVYTTSGESLQVKKRPVLTALLSIRGRAGAISEIHLLGRGGWYRIKPTSEDGERWAIYAKWLEDELRERFPDNPEIKIWEGPLDALINLVLRW